MVCDDENYQSATKAAFEVLHFILSRRLSFGRTTAIDATNVQRKSRNPLLAAAREHHVTPIAIVLNIPEHLCVQRSLTRTDRHVPLFAIWNQAQELRRSLSHFEEEGFRRVHIFNTPEQVDRVTVTRESPVTNFPGD